MVEGPVLIAEAVAAGWEIEAEFVRTDAAPVTSAPEHRLLPHVLEKVATTEAPQPNLAIVRMPTDAVDLSTASFVVVLDRLADPGNAGTVLRSAEAAGVDAVVLTAGSVDRYNPKTVRASAGALFHVPSLVADLDEVRQAGLRLVGTSSHRGTPHTRYDWHGRIALVIGNEAHGLADDAPVDDWVTIDHRGRAESLNAAMAATVLVFEAARQRALR